MLDWLLDTSDFVSRNHCGAGWTPWLVWWNQTANFRIFFAYSVIPILLLRGHRFAKANPNVSMESIPRTLWIAFMAFIVLCGLTHACDVLVFRWPAYRLFTLIEEATADVSLWTIWLLEMYGSRLRQAASKARSGT